MERIHVTIRARPLSAEDVKTSPWRLSGNSIFINHSSKFEFDRVFGEDSKTAEVYQDRIKDIVTAAVRGFNGTVFAYGQTNSGKTHTMRGSPAEPGVIPLAIHDLFDLIQEDMDREFLLRMSYMEIYNEEINDLLVPEHRKLQIHENLDRGIYVAGLREEIVSSSEQVLNFMDFGEARRHIGETNMNLHSSRSHTIFRMIVESREKTEDSGDSCDSVRVSVLNLVDLAGSERAAKTGAGGLRLKEGTHINKSLMTLGTVIKKLSEGAETQGVHVPYRDSKLTRILQPALGGNANTAIICNITLAQIHADETKSSLQFASRALRVTNCAHVNEILTDAALLKRQKKEIEELRAKLQGSHSDHFEEEILSLRNTLLQTELERERIALELEEEKKAQAERDRRLQEQAKKIQNLSSMVLYSNREENHDNQKKGKRRETWCPGNLLQEAVQEGFPAADPKPSLPPEKGKRDMGPLLEFEELLDGPDIQMDVPSKHQQDCSSDTAADKCSLPNPRALVHVTNRKKIQNRNKSSVGNDELADLQAEYEDLLLKSETQRIMFEIQVDCLTKKLSEGNMFLDLKYNDHIAHHVGGSSGHEDKAKDSRGSEALVVIKQLQEKVTMLEMEKISSEKNLDHIAMVATDQMTSAKEKYEKLYEDYLKALEDVTLAREHSNSGQSIKTVDEGDLEFLNKLLEEVNETASEVRDSRNYVDNISLIMDELFQNFRVILGFFLDFKSLTSQHHSQLKELIGDYVKWQVCMQHKVTQLENDKVVLLNQSVELHRQMEEIKLTAQNFEQNLRELSEHHNLENNELLTQIEVLEKNLCQLSSSSLAKEKEILRRDLDKTKVKLKDTEFKLKNAIQERTKLEGVKTSLEREVKQLQSQRLFLERDISKRESLAGRRRDSFANRSSKSCNLKKADDHTNFFETIQEENKNLEVLAFELEATISSLEEQLSDAYEAKEEAISRSDVFSSELALVSEKLNEANLEVNALKEEISALRMELEECGSVNQQMERTLNLLNQEKEELATQLTDSILEMEEEKAIWSSKEKVSVETLNKNARSFDAKIKLLSGELLEVKNELECCRKKCKAFEERMTLSRESENEHSKENLVEINSLRSDLQISDAKIRRYEELLEARNQQVEEMSAMEVQMQNLLESGKKQVEELNKRISEMEITMHNVDLTNHKDKAKLRTRLHWTQKTVNAFRGRLKEATDESAYMHKRFKEASEELKARLALCAVDNLNLKKQLVAAKGLERGSRQT